MTPIPAGLAQRLRDDLPSVADEVEREVRRQVPEFAQPDGGNLRTGVVQALTFFIEHVADPNRSGEAITATYYELGWNTALAGRSLETLQSALRVGGLQAWRLLGRTVEKLGLDSAVMSKLGELSFRTVHEVAEAAAAGYAEARLRDSHELERRRRRLLDLLLGDQPAPPEAVRELAHRAQWTVPDQVAVVVFATASDHPAEEDPPPTPMGALVDLEAHPPRLLLPAPDGSGHFSDQSLALALRDRPAALGPTVALTEAGRSLRWATRALRLAESGVLPRRKLLRCADHLPVLLLHSDQELLEHLRARALGPLEAVPEKQRERLRETLLAWLLSGTNVPDTAARLHVHPQTVRYRMRQLETLFGDAMHDPATRLELVLALHS
ncbi:PucR family transcriptional regulator [Lentzea sp. NEAU-D13]|uniref:PucR family transcriptional regulator n=1 Tax=Lentzea alba TaxID=2714351 RepID=A0A7C9W6L9_9PSEU|nr:PucR family transcriptional regulator [Lentzea alba]NGY64400.1 PucR family transcriptional regulator [Lentzea alba]